MIRQVHSHDIKEICNIDIENRAYDFLPSLGIKFLSLLYKEIIQIESDLSFVFIKDNKIVGFVIGVSHSSQIFKKVAIEYFFSFVKYMLLKLFKNPLIIKNFLETIFYPMKESKANTDAELLVIGVNKKYQGFGIGSKLISSLNETFIKKSVTTYKVTVYKDNILANNFYIKNNFVFNTSFKMYGKEWNIYTYNIL